MLLRVKVLRMERDLTQFDVSNASEISQGRYSMIERGLIEPTSDERARLAAVLGSAPSTLFRRAVFIREVQASHQTGETVTVK